MKYYRIRTQAGVYAGSHYTVDKCGEMRPRGFSPVTNKLLARVYAESDDLQIRADIIRLAQFVQESVEGFSLEEVT
jgi:hypothetical protein